MSLFKSYKTYLNQAQERPVLKCSHTRYLFLRNWSLMYNLIESRDSFDTRIFLQVFWQNPCIISFVRTINVFLRVQNVQACTPYVVVPCAQLLDILHLHRLRRGLPSLHHHTWWPQGRWACCRTASSNLRTSHAPRFRSRFRFRKAPRSQWGEGCQQPQQDSASSLGSDGQGEAAGRQKPPKSTSSFSLNVSNATWPSPTTNWMWNLNPEWLILWWRINTFP